jgi:hypothetical protein
VKGIKAEGVEGGEGNEGKEGEDTVAHVESGVVVVLERRTTSHKGEG